MKCFMGVGFSADHVGIECFIDSAFAAFLVPNTVRTNQTYLRAVDASLGKPGCQRPPASAGVQRLLANKD